jgi:hypothetical protein
MPDKAGNMANSGLRSSAGGLGHDEVAGRNRRQEMRLPCDPGDVLLELAGYPKPVEGHIVEVSRSGLQLRLGTFVPAGESVRVTRAGTIISGQIRYCRPNDAGSFDTGIAIFDVQEIRV